MSLPTWVRSDSVETPVLRLPEHVSAVWTTFLLMGDAVATAIAVMLVALPFHAVPAVCLLVCGSAWLVGGGHLSFAVTPRDAMYHAVAAVILAAIPVLIVLVTIGGFGLLQSIAVLPLTLALILGVHYGVHVMRFGSSVPLGTNDAVSPRTKRRVTSPGFRGLKRALDASLAGLAFIVLGPILLAIAIAIVRESGPPIFFTQERVGRDRHRFHIYKFRTMFQNAGNAWATPGDERITRVGAFLRRTSLDELPQLLNVLRGEMALVGPRPEMPEYAHEFRATIPRYDDRTLVDPGITGWAQVQTQRNLAPSDMDHVVPYDLFYVEHSSFALDLFIAVKTLAEVAFHRAV